ncbi:hypothetical protein JOC85_003304 [Bacillus mesophilus]|nr:hypothetical protein [Bacillus mesophilus]
MIAMQVLTFSGQYNQRPIHAGHENMLRKGGLI